MRTNLLALLPIAALVTACGGGGDAPAAIPSSAAVEPFATCQVAVPANGTAAGRVAIAQDDYSYPQESGVQDWRSQPLSYTNTAPVVVTLQITLAATRQLDTPAGLLGTTDLELHLVMVDDTVNQLVFDPGLASMKPTAPDPRAAGCNPAIRDAAAGAAVHTAELHRVNLLVPPGHKVTFWSLARVAPEAGSTGFVKLTTIAFDLSAVALQ